MQENLSTGMVSTLPHPPVTRELTADDLSWDLRPIDLTLDDGEDMLTAVLIEAESYRLLAVQAIHVLAHLQVAHDQLKNRHHAVLDARRNERQAGAR